MKPYTGLHRAADPPLRGSDRYRDSRNKATLSLREKIIGALGLIGVITFLLWSSGQVAFR